MNDTTIPAPDAATRAALKAMAARGGQNGVRARIVLVLATGEKPARVVARLGVAYATVRAARRRFAKGGADALATRRPRRPPAPAPHEAMRLRGPAPDVLLAAEAEARPHGRLPAARIAVETWVRDAVALGAVKPGAAFPPQRQIQKAFHATPALVNRALSSCARDGFVRTVPGGATSAAKPPPCAGRFLFVTSEAAGNDDIGYMGAATKAAEILEARRGARFEFADGVSLLETPSGKRLRFLASMRRQRWAGVYFRAWTDEMAAAGHVQIDNVPVCLQNPVLNSAKGFSGSLVRRASGEPGSRFRILETLWNDCQAAGCRRVAVVGHYDKHVGFRRADAERAAAAHGLELGPWHYQEMPFVGNSEAERAVVRAALSATFAPGRGWNPDGILLLDDHWLVPLEEVLLAQGEEAARRIRVFCIGNKPALPATRLDVRFRGYDLLSTLASFVDWCDAIHARNKSPPPPTLATF